MRSLKEDAQNGSYSDCGLPFVWASMLSRAVSGPMHKRS